MSKQNTPTYYVDQIEHYQGRRVPEFEGIKPSRLMISAAYPLMQLHAFARELCISANTYEDHPILPFYELTTEQRAAAIGRGAIATSTRKMIEQCARANREVVQMLVQWSDNLDSGVERTQLP